MALTDADKQVRLVAKLFRRIANEWAFETFGITRTRKAFSNSDTHYYRQRNGIPFPRFVFTVSRCMKTKDFNFRLLTPEHLPAVKKFIEEHPDWDTGMFPIHLNEETQAFYVDVRAITPVEPEPEFERVVKPARKRVIRKPDPQTVPKPTPSPNPEPETKNRPGEDNKVKQGAGKPNPTPAAVSAPVVRERPKPNNPVSFGKPRNNLPPKRNY